MKDDFNKAKNISVVESGWKHSRSTKLDWAIRVVAVIIGGYVIFLSCTNASAYFGLIREDRVFEYGSSIMWLLAAMISLTSAFLSKGVSKIKTGIYLFLTLFFVVCSGEEIAIVSFCLRLSSFCFYLSWKGDTVVCTNI